MKYNDILYEYQRYLHVDSKLYDAIFVLLDFKIKAAFKDKDNPDNFLRGCLGNIFYNWKSKVLERTAISLHKDFYKTDAKWNIITHNTYRTVLNTLQELESKQLITLDKGVWFGENNEHNSITTITPTSKLISIFETYKDKEPEENCIVAKTKKDENGLSKILHIAKYPRKVEERKDIIDSFNMMMQGFKIETEWNEVLNCQIYSVYNNINTVEGKHYSLGGRLYCRGKSHQQLSKNDRKAITIDKKALIELDYKCLHIYMIYAMENIQFEGDAYDFVSPKLRPLAKTLLLTSLNCVSKKQTINSLEYHFKEFDDKVQTLFNNQEETWSDLYDKMISRHWKIQHYLSNPFSIFSIGLRLQNKDSCMMLQLLKKSFEEFTPILPVHDSILCYSNKEEYWHEQMLVVYKDITGFNIIVEKA